MKNGLSRPEASVQLTAAGAAKLLGLLLVGTGIFSAPVLGGERLLSHNATYRLSGGGYVYTGQIQPGVNERATVDGMIFSPLVETTDGGASLIDGDASDDSKIYTPWFWNQPGKLIVVEMLLPGDSKVSRVQVKFPEDTDYRPEAVTLHAREPAGTWRQLGRRIVHRERDPVEQSPSNVTFRLADDACRELKIEVGGNRNYVGITEIEVWGEGPVEPAEIERRGLIRRTPHIDGVSPFKSEPPEGARNLAPSSAIRFESSHPLTVGKPAALVDGRRGSGIRIDGRPHQHWEATAEFDLGEVYLIDAVRVWMPGGEGVRTGHMHEVNLAISPTADQVDWDSPTGPIVNPYWPRDDAPRPYAIAAEGLKVPGRRVRVQAYLSGTGAVTSILAVGEIEIWGRRLEGPPPLVARLELRPVEIAPEAIARLALRWATLRNRRVRGIWIAGDLDAPFGDTDKTCGQALADAGFNTVVIYTGVDRQNRSTAPQLEDRLRRNVAEAHKRRMFLLAKWQFGSTHEEPYRRFRGATGRLHERSCCPLQPDYIERHVGRWAVASARLGADGFTFDTEMYESDGTHYPSACHCDSCFQQYVQVYSTDWKSHYDRIRPERRGAWIAANEGTRHYAADQRRRLIEQFDGIRAQCHAVNPDFLLVYAPFLGYLSGLTHGLGTPDRPVIVWSEREYTHGPTSRSIDYLRQIRNQQLPALYVAGHMLWYQDPQTLVDNALLSSLYADGWWAWFGGALVNRIGTDDPEAFKSPYGRKEGFSAVQYLEAIRVMHDRLDTLLAQPSAEWPQSDLFLQLEQKGSR